MARAWAYAGFYFLGDQTPVEGEGALPGFEGWGRGVRGSGRTTFLRVVCKFQRLGLFTI